VIKLIHIRASLSFEIAWRIDAIAAVVEQKRN
jgi:hypothetical protein